VGTGEGLCQLAETGGNVSGTVAVTQGGDGSDECAAYRVSLNDPAFHVEKNGIFLLAAVPVPFLK
jgi:hypothetical protein